MAPTKPVFCAVLGDGQRWTVEVEWSDGTIEQVDEFQHQSEAIGSPTNRKGGCGTGADRPKPRLCGPRDQAIQNGLEASKSAVQRDIPISCRHLSSRLSNSYRERAKCHHSVICRFTSFQRELRLD
jgi:hypothetical protein